MIAAVNGLGRRKRGVELVKATEKIRTSFEDNLEVHNWGFELDGVMYMRDVAIAGNPRRRASVSLGLLKNKAKVQFAEKFGFPEKTCGRRIGLVPKHRGNKDNRNNKPQSDIFHWPGVVSTK